MPREKHFKISDRDETETEVAIEIMIEIERHRDREGNRNRNRERPPFRPLQANKWLNNLCCKNVSATDPTVKT